MAAIPPCTTNMLKPWLGIAISVAQCWGRILWLGRHHTEITKFRNPHWVCEWMLIFSGVNLLLFAAIIFLRFSKWLYSQSYLHRLSSLASTHHTARNWITLPVSFLSNTTCNKYWSPICVLFKHYRSEMVAVLGPFEALPYYIHTYIHMCGGILITHKSPKMNIIYQN
jgi:hypothetical protein